MACACKVNKHIDNIRNQYGAKSPTVKTNINNKIKIFFKKMIIGIICLPFIPIFFIFLLIRKIITNKPISINRFVKLK